MNINALKATLPDILPLRALFLREANRQIRYDACHSRNWSDSYLLTAEGTTVGYGSVKGKDDLMRRDAVFEFYLIPPFRKGAERAFSELLALSGAAFIECQSNDPLLSPLLFEFSRNIRADVVLFEDHSITHFSAPGVDFRRRREGDDLAAFGKEGAGDYVLEEGGEIVATGGFLLHYNMPFADLHMMVRHDCRNRGLGSYLIQELKRKCYESARVPAARCNIQNKASRATLIRAGLAVCGFMLTGDVKTG